MRLDVDPGARWWRVDKWSHEASALADRHYSRQTEGAAQCLPPGRTLLLVTDDGRAVWGVVENLDPAGAPRWRCTIFRNEGPWLSSDLIREATERTYARWSRCMPAVPLTTEVDPRRVRRKRDPGRCFRKAGWRLVDVGRRGLMVFQAPPPGAARGESHPPKVATGQAIVRSYDREQEFTLSPNEAER